MFSMNIIYLDTLFLVNFICDYTLLLCTAWVSGSVIRRIPILFASAIGGIYACLCAFPSFIWMTQPLFKLCCYLLICIVSFSTEKNLLRCSVIFICISSMAGGIMSAISIPYKNTYYIPLQAKTLIPVFAIIYLLLKIYFKNSTRLSERTYHTVSVTLNGKTVSFRALRDSGNELYDPISNRPILVCNISCLKDLFSELPNRNFDPFELFLQLNSTNEYAHRMLLIPCCTVTGSGMLLAFKPDELLIDGNKEPHIIAISKESFKKEAPYQAIY